jgi:hypothetical protein
VQVKVTLVVLVLQVRTRQQGKYLWCLCIKKRVVKVTGHHKGLTMTSSLGIAAVKSVLLTGIGLRADPSSMTPQIHSML